MKDVDLLPVAKGYANLLAGVGSRWGDPVTAYVRGELGAHPKSWLDLFTYGEATRLGWQAGAGARAHF